VNGINHRDDERRSRSPAQLERDAALDRVGRTRRWAMAGAAGLTAAFAALVSVVAPGRTLAARTRGGGATEARTATPSTSSAQMPPLASPAQLGLQSPEQPPQAAAAPSQPSSDPSQAGSGTAQAPSGPSQTGSNPSQAAPTPSAGSDPSQAAPTPAPAPAPAVSGGS
jgi:hypothetical protein